MSNAQVIKDEQAATDREVAKDRATLLAELYTAYDYASANAADPVAQKQFRQKFAECRTFVA